MNESYDKSFSGIAGILWWVLWVFLIHDTPAKHPSISKVERNYIERNVSVQKVRDIFL